MSILRFSLISGLIALTLLLLVRLDWTERLLGQVDSAVLIVSFSMALAVLLYAFLIRISDPGRFVSVFLITLVMKMVGYLAFVVILALVSPEKSWSNVVFSFICYLIFTVLETGALFRAKNGG